MRKRKPNSPHRFVVSRREMGTACGIGYMLDLACGHQKWMTKNAGGGVIGNTTCQECRDEQIAITSKAQPHEPTGR